MKRKALMASTANAAGSQSSKARGSASSATRPKVVLGAPLRVPRVKIQKKDDAKGERSVVLLASFPGRHSNP